ncbi:MAG: SURF1 family protein [Rhizobiales bacterium]|nr:SURF1 family protein [Hyphomicrobiales bacterium]
MTTGATRPAFCTWIVPGILALTGVAVLVGLGTWQIERKAWKEALIAALSERLAQAPVSLPAPDTWDRLAPADNEFRRVVFRAAFLHDRETHVYTVGSALRSDVTGPGYWVFTPARLPDGRLLVVDRGFVPEGQQDPKTRPQGQVSGEIRIIGALRWPEEPGWFTPGPDPALNLWFRRDPAGMALAKGLGPIAPFYVAQEAPIPPGGMPKPGPLTVDLRNMHLQYALTWYGLAAVLIVVFMSWVVSRRAA